MQLDFFDIPNPCVSICESDKKGNCLGCMRTRDERQGWESLNNDEKKKVIKRCIQRKKRKDKQKKGKDVEVVALPDDGDVIQHSLLDPPSKISSTANTDLDFSEFEL